jgi:hypothetical protein
VREQVLAAVFGSDESKAFSVVEPLYGASCHFRVPRKVKKKSSVARTSRSELTIKKREPGGTLKYTAAKSRRASGKAEGKTKLQRKLVNLTR